MGKRDIVEATVFVLGTVAVCTVLAAASGCAAPREPTLCELAEKYPETRDPVVASMFGLPTAGCARSSKNTPY